MAAKIVAFIEDARWVGLYPSHVGGLRQLANSMALELHLIDCSLDGYVSEYSDVTRHPMSTYDSALDAIYSLVDTGSTLVAIESMDVNLLHTVSKIDMFDAAWVHPEDAVYLFGPHNGLHQDFVRPEHHVYFDHPFKELDVRDYIAGTIIHRATYFPSYIPPVDD